MLEHWISPCYIMGLNTYIASFLWSVRTNQRWESAQNCALSYATMNRSLKERCTTEYIYVHIFCRISPDLAFPEKILLIVWGDDWQLKNFWIFLKGFLFVLHCLFHPSKEQQLVKTTFISADDVFSPWRRYIFRHRNMFI